MIVSDNSCPIMVYGILAIWSLLMSRGKSTSITDLFHSLLDFEIITHCLEGCLTYAIMLF